MSDPAPSATAAAPPTVAPLAETPIHVQGTIIPQPPLFELAGATICRDIRRAIAKYPNNNYLGHRAYLADKKRGAFEWRTYKQVGEEVSQLGAGMRLLGLHKGDKVGIMAKNCPEWLILDITCATQSMVSVPVYDSYTREECAFIIGHSEIRIFFCTADMLPFVTAAKASGLPSLEFIVVLDGPCAMGRSLEGAHYRYSQLLEMGRGHPVDDVPPSPDDLFTIVYTSGTTGSPKGAMITHRNMMAASAMLNDRYPHAPAGTFDVMISYLPLAHIFERQLEFVVSHGGAAIGYFSGSIATLTDDLCTLRPTIIPGVPRVFSKTYSKIMQQVNGGLVKWLMFKHFFNYKQKWWLRGAKTPLSDRILFNKIRAKMGGNVRLFYSGSAPLSPEIAVFINVCFGAPIIEGYGLTETCACVTCNEPAEHDFGTVGYPYPECQVKLVDVPEMEYLTTDHPPRGEIFVRGDHTFVGYYKDPVKTAEVIQDGWFRTGDVGTWVPGPLGERLKIIDRVKNIFKLSQGEFVCAERLESSYLSHVPLLHQLMVYGQPTASALVGVVVPDYCGLLRRPEIRQAIENLKAGEAPAERMPPSDFQGEISREYRALMARLPAVKKLLLDECARAAAIPEAGVRRFETIKDLVISAEEWTPENKMLTPSFKMRRDVIKTLFARDLQAILLPHQGGSSAHPVSE
eukprot:GAFH01000972.1.p1 GENE.GAFH01000972.1~~GAFH01000972.1.p1  ORF type:complete len:686 (-),score=155.66 GAFH01000972.1:131-2188(-)